MSTKTEDWRDVPRDKQTPEQRAASDADAQKTLDDFDAGFRKGLAREKAEDAASPKVHDHTKGEFVEDVDPKIADKFLE
jgi:hypothetical protein